MTDEATIKHRKEYTRYYRKNDTIFLKGDLGNCMYVVLKGQVEIQIDDDITVDVIHPGGMFGEMGIIESAPRAAKAVANAETALLVIDEAHFLDLVQETPFFALKVLRTVTMRTKRALKQPDAEQKVST